MPTLRKRKALSKKEIALQAAVEEYKAGKHKTIQAAARFHDVPLTILRHRLKGVQPQQKDQKSNSLLTLEQEEAIV